MGLPLVTSSEDERASPGGGALLPLWPRQIRLRNPRLTLIHTRRRSANGRALTYRMLAAHRSRARPEGAIPGGLPTSVNRSRPILRRVRRQGWDNEASCRPPPTRSEEQPSEHPALLRHSDDI